MRLVSKAELARRAGVSKPAITRACKTGAIREACQGDRVDLDHPSVAAAYPRAVSADPVSGARTDGAPTDPAKSVRRQAVAPTAPAETAPKRQAATDDAPTSYGPDELAEEVQSLGQGVSKEDLLRLTRALRPIVNRHGTRRAFKDWLGALKDLEDIRKRRLDNEETEGRLISRELVKTHIFGAIEGSHRRLLGDAPKTIARTLYGMAKSGEPLEAAEERVRELISTVLKPVKATAARVAENA
jgi:hypothetical protein